MKSRLLEGRRRKSSHTNLTLDMQSALFVFLRLVLGESKFNRDTS